MDIFTAIEQRHSVRQYTDTPISIEAVDILNEEIQKCNEESGLSIQLVLDEPTAFDSFMASYGKFKGVRNYIMLKGKDSEDLEEKAGYYGQRLVIKAQMLELNTCWVAVTFKKRDIKKLLDDEERLACVITIGYGETQGIPHKNKPISKLCKYEGTVPEWFKKGMKAATLAPTTMNQQKFFISYINGDVSIENLGGYCSKIDLGIVKYNFEAAAGKENFSWDKI